MDIDLVYLWVDDKDPTWIEKKKRYLIDSDKYDIDAVDECRFYNNDELKYSLRSVEKNAPWVNKIYIVTDNQIPEWLNTDNPKIKIVDHSEIIPQDKLPIFNSCAIETRIPYIEGLSEYFLYANDDMFFWQPVEKDFFFENNKFIWRISRFMRKYKKPKRLYGTTLLRAYNLIKTKFNPDFYVFYPYHNIDIYKKSDFFECINEFQEEFDETLKHRFRQFDDVQRIIVSFYSLIKKRSVLRNVHRHFLHKLLNLHSDSFVLNLKKKNVNKLKKINAKLVCINDSAKATNEDRIKVKEFLNKKFSEKSSFEKE